MSEHPVKRRKKLIEVAIPLEAINAASAREKSIRHGHPSTLHLWWARRPLAAARAVIFCQMVDDPSAVPEEFPTEEDQENERLRLFALISELVTWENTTNEQVLNRARQEIKRSWRRTCADNADHPEAAELFNPDKLPGFHDPFAGGGALPLEAQRLGLESYASDLNPVAVLINKAMIEIPPKFAGMPPVNPEAHKQKQLIERQWKGAEGLAEDLRYYGQWIRDEAQRKIGHLYPSVEITPSIVSERPDLSEYKGQSLTVVAWIWARTVKSPNPAFSHVDVPLTSTFMLSTKAGKESHVEAVIEGSSYSFRVRRGCGANKDLSGRGTKSSGSRSSFLCLMTGEPISFEYIRREAKSGRLGQRLMAIVVEGKRERIFLSPMECHEEVAKGANPEWQPGTELPEKALGFRVQEYGMSQWADLFTRRQLAGLGCFSDLIEQISALVNRDASESGLVSDHRPLSEGGTGSTAYAEALVIYLSFVLSKTIDGSSTICRWMPQRDSLYNTYSKHALPMTWDFAEVNVLASCTRSLLESTKWTAESVEGLGATSAIGQARQADATTTDLSRNKIVSTDPPYYDNIGYADLSDFFYVWLRRSIRRIFPDIFSTVTVPKSAELIATPHRQGSRKAADQFFLSGMKQAMETISRNSMPSHPITIYYAFKQSETSGDSKTSSTGWETFLAAVVSSGLAITGTWPIRTERENRSIGIGTNALASSVVLVCQRRDAKAVNLSRSNFRRQLRLVMPEVLRGLEKANIAPVDLAQAAIGPGMAIFSNAESVLNPDDSPMSVREALIEVNAALDEYLSQDEGELDADSRFALTFFESFGYAEREFGDAEGLAKARNVSVEGVAKAGILRSVAGKTWLLKRETLDNDWDPTRDDRLCVWEATQHLIRRLETGGEGLAAELLGQLKKVTGHGDLASNCRALAYRLYNHCEKTKQAEEARAYNGLVIAWPELERLASSSSTETTVQASLI